MHFSKPPTLRKLLSSIQNVWMLFLIRYRRAMHTKQCRWLFYKYVRIQLFYWHTLFAISSQSSELALKCFNNRAACYKQLSNFDGTIEDSTQVLEYKPEDIKVGDDFSCTFDFRCQPNSCFRLNFNFWILWRYERFLLYCEGHHHLLALFFPLENCYLLSNTNKSDWD